MQKQPKIHHLLVRIHRLTILLTTQPNTTIDTIKIDVLDALTAPVSQPDLDDVDVQSVNDFELCRVVKSGNTKPGGLRQYEVLEGTQKVKDTKVAGWEVVYVQLRDRASGQLQPIDATDPPIDDDEEPQGMPPPPPVDVKGKGKRKAEDDEEDDLFGE